MGQSFDQNDAMVRDTFPITSMDDIIEELKKPDVEYVKVFMHNGEPSIEKEITQSEALMRSLQGSEEHQRNIQQALGMKLKDFSIE